MDLSIVLAGVIVLQFGYIVMLDRQHLSERRDLYNRIQGVVVTEQSTAAPKGRNSVHASVDPELSEKLKRDGLYQ